MTTPTKIRIQCIFFKKHYVIYDIQINLFLDRHFVYKQIDEPPIAHNCSYIFGQRTALANGHWLFDFWE